MVKLQRRILSCKMAIGSSEQNPPIRCLLISITDDIPLRNVVHRHEPPVTSKPVQILLHDKEREFIVVDKPGSIVRSFVWTNHLAKVFLISSGLFAARACFWPLLSQLPDRNSGRWLWIRKMLPYAPSSHNPFPSPLMPPSLPAVNRLDRLTSGLMIIPLSTERARMLTAEFMAGTVRKEYIARVKGHFPE